MDSKRGDSVTDRRLLPAVRSGKIRALKHEFPASVTGVGAAARLNTTRTHAIAWLVFATMLWGLSFPLAKGLVLAQQRAFPQADGWFLVALDLVIRFGIAATAVALTSRATLRSLTARELSQGVGLGVFATGGMLLQMDGLNYTAASTSAFLTSCYCVIIPVVVAVQRRRLPPLAVALCCFVVLIGLGILAGLDWRAFRLGRGEWETLGCSMFFAGQILWLERPVYRVNRPAHATVIMFTVLTLATVPLAVWRSPGLTALLPALAGSSAITLLLLTLTVACTLTTFSLMNHWQKYLEATEAGLIYCAEPVWTSLASLWLPAGLALWTGAPYPNEHVTPKLIVGGVLITAANIGLQLYPRAVTPVR